MTRWLFILVVPLLVSCASKPKPPPTSHSEELRSRVRRPPDAAPSASAFAESVHRTFNTLQGYSPAAKKAALEDAKFESLQNLARLVAGYLDGPVPGPSSSLVKGARYVHAEVAGAGGISVTAEIILRNALLDYEKSLSMETRNDELMRRIERVRSEKGDLPLRAVGTGVCRESDDRGGPADGIPPSVIR